MIAKLHVVQVFKIHSTHCTVDPR